MAPVFDPDAERSKRTHASPEALAGEVRLNDLYQEVILDHNKSPRNFGKLETVDRAAHGHNPLCGDDYFLYLKLSPDNKVQKLSFEGSGCAISKSSASMMTTLVEGKSTLEAAKLKDDFIKLLTEDSTSEETRAAVGRMKIFEGVKKFPVRVKCATLIWRTLEEALKGGINEVSTEKTGEIK